MRVCLALWLLLACCTGCRGRFQAGVAETVLTLQSGAVGTATLETQGCIWIVGALGLSRGIVAVMAHGGATVESCLPLMPSALGGPLR